jgi:hypothetical protein
MQAFHFSGALVQFLLLRESRYGRELARRLSAVGCKTTGDATHNLQRISILAKFSIFNGMATYKLNLDVGLLHVIQLLRLEIIKNPRQTSAHDLHVYTYVAAPGGA